MHVPEDWNWLRDPDGSSSVSSRELSLTDDWFARFRDLEALFALRQLKPGDTGRVRVAVIDTGIDMGHIAIQAAVENGQIARVCDWVDGREGIEDEKIGDSEGHGTYIASVILDMAPHVDLYIARVSKQRVLSDREAENIAKAICTAALSWECEIISLSCGFTHRIPCIQSALSSVIGTGTLIFAAASNDGINSLVYPARSSGVLCIYSTDGHGNHSHFNPPPANKYRGNADRFSIIGEHVRGAWPSNLSPQGVNNHMRRLSGTSCATPVAAALVACILGFANQMSKSQTLKATGLFKLRSENRIRRVLWKMIRIRDGYGYLDPFQFFNRQNSAIEADIWEALDSKD